MAGFSPTRTGRIRWARSREGLQPFRHFRGNPPPVEKLEAAVTAVVQSAAREPFQEIQEPGVHLIDAIRRLQPRDAVRAALRAARRRAEMHRPVARIEFFVAALTAFKNTEIAEALEECPVNPVEPLSTSRTSMSHRSLPVISQMRAPAQSAIGGGICVTAAGAAQWKFTPRESRSVCSTVSPCMARASTT